MAFARKYRRPRRQEVDLEVCRDGELAGQRIGHTQLHGGGHAAGGSRSRVRDAQDVGGLRHDLARETVGPGGIGLRGPAVHSGDRPGRELGGGGGRGFRRSGPGSGDEGEQCRLVARIPGEAPGVDDLVVVADRCRLACLQAEDHRAVGELVRPDPGGPVGRPDVADAVAGRGDRLRGGCVGGEHDSRGHRQVGQDPGEAAWPSALGRILAAAVAAVQGRAAFWRGVGGDCGCHEVHPHRGAAVIPGPEPHLWKTSDLLRLCRTSTIAVPPLGTTAVSCRGAGVKS